LRTGIGWRKRFAGDITLLYLELAADDGSAVYPGTP
jgi:hypothetical protein